MTKKELEKAIRSAAKTANSRIRRARRAGLPTSSTERLETARKMNSPLVTESGFVSATTKGLTEKQLQQKLKWIRGITEQTETVEQARKRVQQKAKEWNVSEETAKHRLESGRIFSQILTDYSTIFDSNKINEVMNEFNHTPTYDELIEALFMKYGKDLQDLSYEREFLRRWINENKKIPDGVNGSFNENDEFVFDDEKENTEDEYI